MTGVDEYEETDELLALQRIVLDHRLELLPAILAQAGVAIAWQVH